MVEAPHVGVRDVCHLPFWTYTEDVLGGTIVSRHTDNLVLKQMEHCDDGNTDGCHDADPDDVQSRTMLYIHLEINNCLTLNAIYGKTTSEIFQEVR